MAVDPYDLQSIRKDHGTMGAIDISVALCGFWSLTTLAVAWTHSSPKSQTVQIPTVVLLLNAEDR